MGQSDDRALRLLVRNKAKEARAEAPAEARAEAPAAAPDEAPAAAPDEAPAAAPDEAPAEAEYVPIWTCLYLHLYDLWRTTKFESIDMRALDHLKDTEVYAQRVITNHLDEPAEKKKHDEKDRLFKVMRAVSSVTFCFDDLGCTTIALWILGAFGIYGLPIVDADHQLVFFAGVMVLSTLSRCNWPGYVYVFCVGMATNWAPSRAILYICPLILMGVGISCGYVNPTVVDGVCLQNMIIDLKADQILISQLFVLGSSSRLWHRANYLQWQNLHI